MTLDARLATVARQAEILGPRLYEGMSVAIHAADSRAKGLHHTTYPHLRPLLTRAEAREYWEHELLPQPWKLGGNPGLMGQLSLEAPELGLSLRLLKERLRTYPEGVPPAGRNPARRRDWQEPLPLEEPLDDRAPSPIKLLLLWDYMTSESDRGAAFSLRIVHPIEAGEYGRAVRCDLDLRVRVGGTIFDQLAFAGDTQEHDFFADIDEAGTDEGSSA